MATVIVCCKHHTGIHIGDNVVAVGPANPDAKAKGLCWGYALTHNVDEKVWQTWHGANLETPLVKNNLIFAEPTIDAARNRCRRYRKVSGAMSAGQNLKGLVSGV